MAALPLSLTVDSCANEHSRRRSASGLALSIAVQGLVLASLGVAPLLSTDDLPEPQSRTRIQSFLPVIHVPAGPPLSRPGTSSPPVSTGRPTFVSRGLAPTKIPIGIVPETGLFDEGPDVGVPGGDPLGVPGAPPRVAAPPAEPPAPRRPLVIRDGVRPPRKTHHVSPIYPRTARLARVEGMVVVEATIDENGNVSGVTVRRSIPLLDAAAIEAVRQWKYEPTLLNGRPVPVLLSVNLLFQLDK